MTDLFRAALARRREQKADAGARDGATLGDRAEASEASAPSSIDAGAHGSEDAADEPSMGAVIRGQLRARREREAEHVGHEALSERQRNPGRNGTMTPRRKSSVASPRSSGSSPVLPPPR
jgi:hypothetical protein